jgi:hypothetical protein
MSASKKLESDLRHVNWRIRASVRQALKFAAIAHETTSEQYVDRLLGDHLQAAGFMTPTTNGKRAKK